MACPNPAPSLRLLFIGASIALVCALPAPGSAQPAPEPVEIDLRAALRGEGRPMTADQAAALAVETGPSIERAREALRQASAGADRALYGFVPQLRLSTSYTRLTPVENGRILPDEAVPVIERVEDPASR